MANTTKRLIVDVPLCAILAVIAYVFVIGATKFLSAICDGQVAFWPEANWFHVSFIIFLMVGFIIMAAMQDLMYDSPYRPKIEMAWMFYKALGGGFVCNLLIGSMLAALVAAFVDNLGYREYFVPLMVWTWRISLVALIGVIFKIEMENDKLGGGGEKKQA